MIAALLLLQIDVEREIRRLGSEEVAERDAAVARLVEAGDRAIEPLKRSLNSPDPEIAARARIALRALRPAPIQRLFDEAAALVEAQSAGRLEPADLKRLVAGVREISDACAAADKQDYDAPAFEAVGDGTALADGQDEVLRESRLLASGASDVSAANSLLVVDGDLSASSLVNCIVVATGSVDVRMAQHCLIVARRGVSTPHLIQNCTVVTPGPVSFVYLLNASVAASGATGGRIFQDCVLINGKAETKNRRVVEVESADVAAWMSSPFDP